MSDSTHYLLLKKCNLVKKKKKRERCIFFQREQCTASAHPQVINWKQSNNLHPALQRDVMESTSIAHGWNLSHLLKHEVYNFMCTKIRMVLLLDLVNNEFDINKDIAY